MKLKWSLNWLRSSSVKKCIWKIKKWPASSAESHFWWPLKDFISEDVEETGLKSFSDVGFIEFATVAVIDFFHTSKTFCCYIHDTQPFGTCFSQACLKRFSILPSSKNKCDGVQIVFSYLLQSIHCFVLMSSDQRGHRFRKETRNQEVEIFSSTFRGNPKRLPQTRKRKCCSTGLLVFFWVCS